MRRVQRLLGWVDRVQRRSRWLGFPFAVMGKFRDDHGGALTTVIAYNAFFALFPLLLVVVTVLGFLLGRDSGFPATPPRLGGGRLPHHRRPGTRQHPWAARQRRRPGDRLGGLRLGRARPDPGRPARHGRDLEHPGQAAALLLGPAGPRAAAAGGLRRWPGRDQPADLAGQLRRQGGRGSARQSRGRGRGQRRAVPAGVPGAHPQDRSRPDSCLLVRWSLGWPGRSCKLSVATWSATTCVTPARCMGCSRSSLACCSGCIWAHGSPCTPQKSTSWPPGGSGRAACCSHQPANINPPASAVDHVNQVE